MTAPQGSGIGVFVQDSAGVYCEGAATMPTSTTMQTQDLADGHQTFTVYVVARTSATAPDPLHGMAAWHAGIAVGAEQQDARGTCVLCKMSQMVKSCLVRPLEIVPRSRRRLLAYSSY